MSTLSNLFKVLEFTSSAYCLFATRQASCILNKTEPILCDEISIFR